MMGRARIKVFESREKKFHCGSYSCTMAGDTSGQKLPGFQADSSVGCEDGMSAYARDVKRSWGVGDLNARHI